MSKTININAETIKTALQSSKPTSLTGLWKALGRSGSVSGSASKRMRNEFPGLEAILAENKAGTAKAEGDEVSPKSKPAKKADKKPAKSHKSTVSRHSKNPFRDGSSYGLLVDLISAAGSKGIGKETLLAEFCRLSGKDLQHAKYDLAVINSASEDSDKRHKSCADGFTIVRTVDNYRISFS